MNASLKDWWIDSVAKIAAARGVGFAAWNYFRQSRTRHAEWLESLYERFYENDAHKVVRRWLDYEELEIEFANDPTHEKEEKFADFLNFFEFIASLEYMRQLSLTDIRRLFNYYLSKISLSNTCRKFIDDYQYVNLKKLLVNLTRHENNLTY